MKKQSKASPAFDTMSFKAGLEMKTDFEVTPNRAVPAVPSVLCQCLSACFLVHVGEPDHSVGSATTKPTSDSQSPDSAQPPPPAPGDQAEDCSPDLQHPNISSQNEVMAPNGKVGTSQGVNLAAMPRAHGVYGSSCCFCVREREICQQSNSRL